MNVELLKPSLKYQQSFLSGLIECEQEGREQSWIYLHESEANIVKQDFKTYVEKLINYEFVAHKNFVRGVTFWAIMDDLVVGRLGLRLELNEELKKFGGHIGYIVRPSYRRRGIASKMLALALETHYALSLKNILLTCDYDNEASEKTILKNGGKFLDIIGNENGKDKKRFLINL